MIDARQPLIERPVNVFLKHLRCHLIDTCVNVNSTIKKVFITMGDLLMYLIKAQFTKQLAIIAGAAVAILSFPAVAAHAYTDLGNNSNIQYVKVKRPIFTGQYTKINGKRGHKIITPKGTILKVEGSVSTGDGPSSAQLTRGLVSYQKQQHIYQVTKGPELNVKQYNTKYFTSYKLKLPIRTLALQAGNGYTNNKAGNYRPIFYITLDGYLQYYTTARLKHYGVLNSWQSTKPVAAVDNPLWTIKPSASVKLSTFKVKGNTSYVYYKKAIKGLPAKKVSSKYYRLAIKKLGTQNKKWHTGDKAWPRASWTTYNVGGRSFYNLVDISEGD